MPRRSLSAKQDFVDSRWNFPARLLARRHRRGQGVIVVLQFTVEPIKRYPLHPFLSRFVKFWIKRIQCAVEVYAEEIPLVVKMKPSVPLNLSSSPKIVEEL